MKYKIYRIIALILFFVFGIETFAPIGVYALTSGPTTPEVQSFEPSGTDQMVDLFTGDFNYNIPLFELPGPNGGYPFNLAYHSGIGMDQEASWVGLGWNINPGAINREVRGKADDFSGDEIETRQDIKTNWTVGVKGGVNLEIFGADLDKGTSKGGVSLGLNLYYNSYRGMGYSLDMGVNYHGSGKKSSSGIGLNLSMDSQEGASLRPSLTLSDKKADADDESASLNVSVGINSRRGLTDLSMGVSGTSKKAGNKAAERSREKKMVGGEETNKHTFGVGHSGSVGNNSTISFAATAYSPSIDMPMSGSNISMTFKMGLAETGVLGSFYVGAYYSEQHIKDANKNIKRKAYGYLNFQGASKGDLTDYNREKDGLIRDQTPNLACPNITYDAYSILGQGVGGMFRPYRSGVTSLYDDYKSSVMGGGAFGFELGVGSSDIPHFGIDASINVSKSRSGPWENFSNTNIGFDKNKIKPAKNDFPDYEETYFKILGESTVTGRDDINGINQYDYFDNDKLVLPSDVNKVKNYSTLKQRVPRNSVVQPLTNKQLLASNASTGILPEYRVKYYSASDITNYYKDIKVSGNGSYLDRNFANTPKAGDKVKHIGGYSILQADGSRYVYALPVYNHKQRDVIYSCDLSSYQSCAVQGPIPSDDNDAKNYHKKEKATDQYLNWTETPGYTTSHLLSNILGADYVDVDNNGPSDNDFGYWVKFNYVKIADASDPYKWKAPYLGSNVMKGNNYRIQDDKASYTYGEKEIYNLATAETKTHIAVFILKPRKDGLGVSTEFQNASSPKGDKRLYRVDRIELYEKSNYFDQNGNVSSTKKPISTVHFQYSYELCKNIPNFSDISDSQIIGSENGKLTLKKVWFTYERSSKGALTPYVFNYDNSNPDYNTQYQDRWGNYKNYGLTPSCDQFDFPYVKQTGTDANDDIKAWNLSSIETPSGSKIVVNYESDDYSHVQNKVATQMFKIACVESSDESATNNTLYNWRASAPDPTKKIFFELEQPIANTADVDELLRYIDDLKTPGGYQLYYKIKIKLRRYSEQLEEYVTGYAPFTLLDKDGNKNYGYDPNSVVNGKYTRAYLILSAPKVKGGVDAPQFHPFSMAAWQYIKVNMPDECATAGRLSTPPGSKQNTKDKALELLSAVTSIRDLFTNYYNRCRRNAWATQLDLSSSWIRLNSPDRIKYGGGHRVSKITIEDSWDKDFEGASANTQYGVVYDYKTDYIDENGNQVTENGVKVQMSSGVAQYEPIIGGDEIALRYAKLYTESIPLKTDNNMFFEFPINEGYFPAPVVGYSKVTVRSLATDNIIKNPTTYAGIPTTGQVIHEFYTAKDYPVITEESNLANNRDPFHLFIPLPFLGEIKIDDMQAEQAYKIELNDMHGKPKKVSYYAQDKDGKILGNAISWVEYAYKHTDNVLVNQKLSKKLANNVKVLAQDGGAILDREMGVEYDFFTDLRYSYTRSGQGGVSINSDILNFFVVVIPAFVPWPNISYTQAEARLAVSNKVIHRAGILETTTAYDGGTTVTTSNLYYDAQTGRPVLTSVDNNYGAPIYRYNIPAHWVYDGMGAAYKNIGFEDEITLTDKGNGLYDAHTDYERLYVPGDVLLLNYDGATNNKYLASVIRKGQSGGGAELELLVEGSSALSGSYPSIIVKSGRKNLLTADVGNVVALKNPLTRDNVPLNCNVNNGSFTVDNRVDIPDEWISFWFNNLEKEDGTNKRYWAKGAGQPGGGNWINIPISTIDLNYRDQIQKWLDNSFGPGLTTISYGLCTPHAEQWNSGNCTFPHAVSSGVLCNCNDVNGPACGHASHLKLSGNRNLECHGWLAISTTNTLDPNSDFYGGIVNGDWDNSNDHAVITKRYITSIERYDEKRFVVNFEDGKKMVSEYIYRGTAGSLCSGSLPSYNCTSNNAYKDMDEVLTASAVKMKDAWVQDLNEVKPAIPSSDNLYKTGERGNWKPYEAYTYVKDRDKSIASTQRNSGYTNLEKDGTFNNVPVFDWKNPAYSNCFPEWRLGNTITSYNAYGYETENKDILDNHSAALYSYNGKLSVAVGNNAKSNELGFEGFEEYVANNISPINTSTGHFTFFNSCSNYLPYRTDMFNVAKASGNIAVLGIPNSEFKAFYKNTALSGLEVKYEAETSPIISGGIETYPFEYISGTSEITSIATTTDNVPATVINLSAQTPEFKCCANRCWNGQIAIPYALPLYSSDNTGKISFSNKKAHTGRISMEVKGEASFPQFNLKLEAGKKYVFGAWVNSDFTTLLPPNVLNDMISSTGWGIQLGYGKIGGTITQVGNFSSTSEPIDGWRRVEGTFTVPAGLTVEDLWFITVKPFGVSIPIYIDDMRIHPFDAGFQSYVYNPKDYKLVATLDANNFATFYSYDAEGNLFLVRRETEKGILTIEETKANIKH